MKRNLFPTTPDSDPQARIVALEKAIDTHGTSIIACLWRMTGDHHLAEDLAQEVWLKVFDSFDIADMSKWPFLHRKAYQVFIDAMRKRKVRKAIATTEILSDVEGANYYAQPSSDEDEAALKTRFWAEYFPTLKLPDAHKEAFWLKERYGYGLVEIGKMLNVPKSTVHDWIEGVKKSCREYLNQETHEERTTS